MQWADGEILAANAAGNLFGRLFSVQNMTGAFGLVARALGSVGRFAAAAWPVVRAFVSALGPGFMAGIAPLRSLFASLLSGGPPSERTMQLITIAARGIGNALGFAAGAVVTFTAGMGALAAGITAVWGTIGGLVAAGITSIRTMFSGIGANIVDGIIAGINGGAARLGEAVRGMGRNAVQSARQALGIASPSRVFADVIGRQIPAGIEVGIQRGAGPLDHFMLRGAAPRRARDTRQDLQRLAVRVLGAALARQPARHARLRDAEGLRKPRLRPLGVLGGPR